MGRGDYLPKKDANRDNKFESDLAMLLRKEGRKEDYIYLKIDRPQRIYINTYKIWQVIKWV